MGKQTGDPQEVPAIYKELGEKVEAFAEGIVGGGWLWVCPPSNQLGRELK